MCDIILRFLIHHVVRNFFLLFYSDITGNLKLGSGVVEVGVLSDIQLFLIGTTGQSM